MLWWNLLVLAHCRTTTQFLMTTETSLPVLRNSGRFVTPDFSDHGCQIGIIRITHRLYSFIEIWGCDLQCELIFLITMETSLAAQTYPDLHTHLRFAHGTSLFMRRLLAYARFVLQMFSFGINLKVILFFYNAPGHVQSLYDLSENIKSCKI